MSHKSNKPQKQKFLHGLNGILDSLGLGPDRYSPNLKACGEKEPYNGEAPWQDFGIWAGIMSLVIFAGSLMAVELHDIAVESEVAAGINPIVGWVPSDGGGPSIEAAREDRRVVDFVSGAIFFLGLLDLAFLFTVGAVLENRNIVKSASDRLLRLHVFRTLVSTHTIVCFSVMTLVLALGPNIPGFTFIFILLGAALIPGSVWLPLTVQEFRLGVMNRSAKTPSAPSTESTSQSLDMTLPWARPPKAPPE